MEDILKITTSFFLIIAILILAASCGASKKTQKQPVENENKKYWDSNNVVEFVDFTKEVHYTQIPTYLSRLTFFDYIDSINNKCSVHALFIKSESWMLQKDSSFLRYEQYHFNLYEYYVRVLRKALLAKKPKFYSQEFKELMIEHARSLAVIDEKYRKASNFGKNTEAQLKWEKYIDSLLYELKEYASPIIEY